jgi:UrcA family protein
MKWVVISLKLGSSADLVLRRSLQNGSRLKLQPTATTKRENAMKNLTTCIAVALISTSAFNIARADAAGADAPGDARSQTVRFADLNINDSSGAERLYRRLGVAANNVCRGLEPGRSLALVTPYRACIHSALSKAVADVGNPTVLAYAAAHGMAAADVTVRVAQAK